MKTFTIIAKVLAALAAVAGVVYLAATYGDKIVAWCKKLLASCPCCSDTCDCGECDCKCEGDCDDCKCEGDCEASCPCDEAAAEEAPVEEAPIVEEVVVAEGEPVAEESDFEA